MGDQGSYTELAPDWAKSAWFRFPREFIRDRRLSWEARAVAAWMASHDPSFRFDVAYIVQSGPAGRDRVRRIMRELEEVGYLVRTRTRNPDGSFGQIVYRLYPQPQVETPRSEPAPENPAVVETGSRQNRRSGPAPDYPSPGQPSPGSQEGYKETDLEEKEISLPRVSGVETFAAEVGTTEEEMTLLLQKIRKDHPHVKAPLAWLRTCYANGDLPAMLAEVHAPAGLPAAVPPRPCKVFNDSAPRRSGHSAASESGQRAAMELWQAHHAETQRRKRDQPPPRQQDDR